MIRVSGWSASAYATELLADHPSEGKHPLLGGPRQAMDGEEFSVHVGEQPVRRKKTEKEADGFGRDAFLR